MLLFISSRKDMTLAVLIAARKGDVKIVRAILEEDKAIVQDQDVLKQAVAEGLTSFFEVIVTSSAPKQLKMKSTEVQTLNVPGNRSVHC